MGSVHSSFFAARFAMGRSFFRRYFLRIELVALIVVIRSLERRWSEYLLLSESLPVELLRMPGLVMVWAGTSALAFVFLIGILVSAPLLGLLAMLSKDRTSLKERAGRHWRRAAISIAAFALPAIAAALWYDPEQVADYQREQLSSIAQRFSELPTALQRFTQRHGGAPPTDLSVLVPGELQAIPRAPFHWLRVQLFGEPVSDGWTYQVLTDASGSVTGWVLGVDASLEGHPASLHTPPQSGPLDSQCVSAGEWQLCRQR